MTKYIYFNVVEKIETINVSGFKKVQKIFIKIAFIPKNRRRNLGIKKFKIYQLDEGYKYT